jgi:hypothetical protein
MGLIKDGGWTAPSGRGAPGANRGRNGEDGRNGEERQVVWDANGGVGLRVDRWPKYLTSTRTRSHAGQEPIGGNGKGGGREATQEV